MGGRRRKGFIDKKKSATFQLLPRDSTGATDANPSDRVFVRVDNNPHYFDDSIFADATDNDEEPCRGPGRSDVGDVLPDHVRREILDLGLPDDGYNYLLHLREISGSGSLQFSNPNACLDRIHHDFKAYDASKLIVDRHQTLIDFHDAPLPSSEVPAVKVPPKALDPDFLNLFQDDDGDLSRFGSDLEDDFVIQAGEYLEEDGSLFGGKNDKDGSSDSNIPCQGQYEIDDEDMLPNHHRDHNMLLAAPKPRTQRPLDQQFELLTLQEYDISDDDENIQSLDDGHESLAVKLKDVLKDYSVDDLELEDKYKVPGDFVNGTHNSSTVVQVDDSSDVIRRCLEYAEKYNKEAQSDEDEILVHESSDESEVWDCETIISTYSNLDNHPGKIEAPSCLKNRVYKTSENPVANNSIIVLRGKEKLPVDFLPNKRKVEKSKKALSSVDSSLKQISHSQESKEEKKTRKAAIKEERRKARKEKKELKNLYSCATQRAQKVAAFTGPSSVHIM